MAEPRAHMIFGGGGGGGGGRGGVAPGCTPSGKTAEEFAGEFGVLRTALDSLNIREEQQVTWPRPRAPPPPPPPRATRQRHAPCAMRAPPPPGERLGSIREGEGAERRGEGEERERRGEERERRGEERRASPAA
eukprot:2414881-Prymnesium_polylepis.1